MRIINLSTIFVFSLLFSACAQNKTIPFELKNNRIFINVDINRKEYPFIYDTGAYGFGRIDSTLTSSDSKVKIIGAQSNFDGVNYSDIDEVRVDYVNVGGVVRNNVEMLSRNYNRGRDSIAFHGIIGQEFFKNYLVTINFRDNVIQLEKGNLSLDEPNVLALKDGMGIEIKIGNKIFNGHIDTGSMLYLHMPMNLTKSIKTKKLSKSGTGRRANTEFYFYSGKVLDTIKIGDNIINGDKVLFSEKANSINIGIGLISEYNITFDFKNKYVKLCKE